jgi:hypothetical protein
MAIGIAVALTAGCADWKSPAPKDTGTATLTPPTANQSKPTTGPLTLTPEPEIDKEPAHFDAADANRTLRWIAAVTQQWRQPATAPRTTEQSKAVQSALAECLRQKVKWNFPVEGLGADNALSLAPVRLTRFAGHSEKSPEMTLRVRPWNTVRSESLFVSPPHAWLSTISPGQGMISVQGQIAGIHTDNLYSWFISLSDLRFAPTSDVAQATPPEPPPPEKFDADNADNAYAWLRQRIYTTFDPYGTPGDRERKKKDVLAQFRPLTGTKVRWSWPTSVADEYSVAVQDVVFKDYPQQVLVLLSLHLKQPKRGAKGGQPVPGSRLEYSKEFRGAPGNTMINPETTAKIRDAKKSTVSGKIAKVSYTDGGVYPPRALEIVIRLDDVVIEP